MKPMKAKNTNEWFARQTQEMKGEYNMINGMKSKTLTIVVTRQFFGCLM